MWILVFALLPCVCVCYNVLNYLRKVPIGKNTIQGFFFWHLKSGAAQKHNNARPVPLLWNTGDQGMDLDPKPSDLGMDLEPTPSSPTMSLD